MPEPHLSPPRERRALPWVLGLGTLALLAIVLFVVALVAQPGPVAAAKRDATAACRDAVRDSTVVLPPIESETAYTSMDWSDERTARQGYANAPIPAPGDMTADEQSAIDESYMDARGEGRETVWVLWNSSDGDLWECEVHLVDGEVDGATVIASYAPVG